MKKKITYLLAIAAAMLSFSCAKNAVEEPASKPEGFITVSCTLSDALENSDPDSKVTLTHEGSVGKTRWVVDDEVLFHGKKIGADGSGTYSYVARAYNIQNDGKTASFDIPDLDEKLAHDSYKSSLFAIYPASAVYDYSDGASWYYTSAFKETNHLLLAGFNNPVDRDPYLFKFVNLTGALSFKVSGDFDSYQVMGNNNEELAYDKYTITAAITTSGYEEIRSKYTGSTGAGATSGAHTLLEVTPAGSDWHNGSTVNTVYFPNGANFSSGFTIKFMKDGDEVKRVSTLTAKNIARGKYLDLGDITSHLYTYVPPATHNSSISMAGAVDLSSSASANCYVVNAGDAANAGKVFTFKAYRGNSSVGVGSISSAILLWETYNNEDSVTANSVIEAVDYDKQAENDFYTIVFKMPSTLHAGNAVIAARNSDNDILWSWHIWVPANMYTTDTFGISSKALMSRNLGALVDTEAAEATVDARSFGLIYQWGRKDPFVGSKRFGSSSQAPVSGTAKSNSGAQFTVAQSIANPATFVNYKGDWMTPEDRTLWSNDAKTIYDPCPPGYRVPKRVSSDPIWSDVTALDSSYGWEPNSTYGWWKLGTAVFPFAGYIDYDGGSVAHASDRTRIWTAYKGEEYYAYDQQIWYESAEWKSKPSWQHRTACGNSVRCSVE